MTRSLSILIFGKNGQLARALERHCKTQNIPTRFIGSSEADLAKDPRQARDIIYASEANTVINAAAYTQVDKAEVELNAATALNARAPAVMARACKELDKSFIHISTDYVFNGHSDTPYKIYDSREPINIYGETKFQGELSIDALDHRTTTIRTSWVYDGTGKNFLTTMLRLAETHTELSVVNDQIGRPTYAGDLALACLKIAAAHQINPYVGDMYHVTNSGDPISWADFARAIFKASKSKCRVNNILTHDYPTPAKRPAYSVLDISEFEQDFGRLPTWQEGLARALTKKQTL